HLDQIALQLHAAESAESAVNSIATDAAVPLDAQRIAVAQRTGSRWSVAATTGVSQPNDRSDAVREIISVVETRQLAEQSAVAADLSSKSDPTANVPEDAGGRLVLPLSTSGTWHDADWAAVMDFNTPPSAPVVSAVQTFRQHAAIALRRCGRAEQNTFGRRVSGALRRLFAPLWLLTAAAILVGITVLPVVTVPLEIEAYGALVPAARAFVFAPEDGTIDAVAVEDGAVVSQGSVLCTLLNEDLQYQREAVEGELAATAARIAAIDGLRGRGGSAAAQDGLLSAERLELEEQSESLRRQVDILQGRIEQLTVTAKLAGRVYGDRLQELLLRRPVRRGQYLFEIADPAGAWQLELNVAEEDIRYVIDAQRRTSEPLRVRYTPETSPGVSGRATVSGMAGSTEPDALGRLSTLVTADTADGDFSAERPGAGVVAYIECERQPIGFVWFRRIIEFVQRKTWL
ncbi:MAG: biotin/lipoyl-binding protein, partial [Planctomycetaceae bacterium]|nr:biotin/lipoyl-binding protein [Planctomycetaceae bacterium]